MSKLAIDQAAQTSLEQHQAQREMLEISRKIALEWAKLAEERMREAVALFGEPEDVTDEQLSYRYELYTLEVSGATEQSVLYIIQPTLEHALSDAFQATNPRPRYATWSQNSEVVFKGELEGKVEFSVGVTPLELRDGRYQLEEATDG